MAPLRCAAKCDPFLFLECAPTSSTLAQSKERKGSNFAIWQHCYEDLLCTNMDFLTDTNGCKWRNSLSDDYAHCTKALNFARDCGMEYRVVRLVGD